MLCSVNQQKCNKNGVVASYTKSLVCLCEMMALRVPITQ